MATSQATRNGTTLTYGEASQKPLFPYGEASRALRALVVTDRTATSSRTRCGVSAAASFASSFNLLNQRNLNASFPLCGCADSTNDVNAAFYFAQIPNNFFLSGSVGFQECPWQADGCEPKGCEPPPPSLVAELSTAAVSCVARLTGRLAEPG